MQYHHISRLISLDAKTWSLQKKKKRRAFIFTVFLFPPFFFNIYIYTHIQSKKKKILAQEPHTAVFYFTIKMLEKKKLNT